MARFVLGLLRRTSLTAAACLTASLCLYTPVALAQHGGGHSGAGTHFGGGHASAPHISAPHALPPQVSSPTATHVPAVRFRVSGPVAFRAGATVFRFPRRPPRGLPIVPFPVFFGPAFYGFWPGFGFNSLWWPSCDPFWGWGFGCSSSPYYGYGLYGFGSGTGSDSYVPPPAYEPAPAPYAYSGGLGRELPQLYLKDGTVYNVTDYWLVQGQIHFITVDDAGTKSVEHVIPFEDVNLQRTIDVNTRLGFKFVLRNEPVDQYLQHHLDAEPPAPPPQ